MATNRPYHFVIASGYIVNGRPDGTWDINARIAARTDSAGVVYREHEKNPMLQILLAQANGYGLVLQTLAEVTKVLERISRAHESKNNGAAMGEAVLCEAFALQAREALALAKAALPD